jgi:hypothetical protein
LVRASSVSRGGQEGDSLYLPTFWQHAVESDGTEFGATVAWCWGTPSYLFDPRLPLVRSFIWRVLATKHGPTALASAARSLVNPKRLGRPAFSV